MRKQLRSGRPSIAAVALCAVAMAACVQPKEPGVGMTALQSDIVFGVEEAAKEAVPVAFDVPDEGTFTAERAAADTEIPQFVPAADPQLASPKVRVPRATPRRECPDAALNAFPDRPTSANLPANMVPALGEYRWRKRGAIQYASLPIPIGIDGFEKRRLQKFVQISPPNLAGTKNNLNPDGYRANFSYEFVQPKLDGQGATITTFKVATAGGAITTPAATVYPPGGELSLGNPVTGNTVAYRDPEAGVSIGRIENFDRSGNSEGIFDPQVGLLVLPLGVREGERFQSAAVDPGTGQAAQLTGFIKDKSRVDACGSIIEGWFVEATLSMAGRGPTVSRPWHYVISTNLGGILISELTQFVNTEGTFQLNYSIGQVVPDPPAA